MRLKAPIVVPNTDDSLDQQLEDETPEDANKREQRDLLKGFMRQELLAIVLQAKLEFAHDVWSSNSDVKTTQLDRAIKNPYLPGRLSMLLTFAEEHIKIYHGKRDQKVDVVSYGPAGSRTKKQPKFSIDKIKTFGLS